MSNITEKLGQAADKLSNPAATIPTGGGAVLIGGISPDQIGLILQIGGGILIALQIIAITPKVNRAIGYWLDWWKIQFKRWRGRK